MREIRFRAWDSCLDKMVTWDELANSFAMVLYDKNYEVMQFTGLRDSKGVDIYEGDVVRVQSQYETDDPIDSTPNKVYFRDGAFRCGFHDMILGENVCTGKAGNWNMEVVGNIYDKEADYAEA